jgi:hypothetical protein
MVERRPVTARLFQISNLLYPAIADAKGVIPDLFVQESVVVLVGTVLGPGQLSDRIDRQGSCCVFGVIGVKQVRTIPLPCVARSASAISTARESRFPDPSDAPASPVLDRRFLPTLPREKRLPVLLPDVMNGADEMFRPIRQSFEASHSSQSRNTHLDSISIALD